MVLALTVPVVVAFVARRGEQPGTYPVELGPPPGAQAGHSQVLNGVAVVVVVVAVVADHETRSMSMKLGTGYIQRREPRV